MKNRRLSPKNLLKELNYKKYLKSKDTVFFNGINLCKEDFQIENLTNKGLSKNHNQNNKDGPDKSNDNLIPYKNIRNFLDTTSSCQISDALQNISGRNGILKGITSINGQKTYGLIVTIKTNSDDWGTGLFGIDIAKEDEILFILATGDFSAVWGELTSTCAKNKKIAGTIIHGATRDVEFLSNYDYPIFAKEIVPNAGKALGLGEINVDLNIDDYVIHPGDFIFGDENGVVLVPKELFQQTMLETLDIRIKELEILSKIKEGKSLSEIVGLK